MGNLNQIANRHGRDRWKDAIFIAAAVLLTALSIGATTSQGVGKSVSVDHQWSVQLIDPNTNVELNR